MAIEPHSNSKLLQELLDKLNEQSGNSNHEELQGLLGGDASGHFHLTAEQLLALDNIISGANNHENLSGLLGGDNSGHFHLKLSEFNKLLNYPEFHNLNHETLQGLLGGNSSGHYHLTVDLLNKLINLPASGGGGGGGSGATIQIGTVTTGAAGSNASVTNSGTPTNAVFNFVIPRGDKGEAGAGSNIDIVNNLNSSRTDAALSAYQGKLLNDKIKNFYSEDWTFTLDNGSTVTQKVVLSS
jgi:hypothetical protein